MGGYGSGRPGWRPRASEMLRLDVTRLRREGMLAPGRLSTLVWSFSGGRESTVGIRGEVGAVVLEYRVWTPDGPPQRVEERLAVKWSPCPFGGASASLICPSCGKPARVFYAKRFFRCKRCLNVAYQSQLERKGDRMMRKAHRLRGRLGWSHEAHLPDKPKGMRWKTYFRLVREVVEAEREFVRSYCYGDLGG